MSEPSQPIIEYRAVLDRFDEAKCVTCSATFGRFAGSVEDVCPDCREAHRRGAEADRILEDIERTTYAFMARAGISKRELTANLSKIPGRLGALLLSGEEVQAKVVRMMRSGQVPPNGFGLSGETGTGKSFALSAILREMVSARIALRVPEIGRAALGETWLAWVSWPEAVSKFRVLATQEDGLPAVRREIDAMSTTPVLVLDDLGVERFTGSVYSEDWMASQLDLLVDSRYNEMRPTWYTTNLSTREFVERYGTRLYSRLCAENPLVRVPPSADLRMVRS